MSVFLEIFVLMLRSFQVINIFIIKEHFLIAIFMKIYLLFIVKIFKIWHSTQFRADVIDTAGKNRK